MDKQQLHGIADKAVLKKVREFYSETPFANYDDWFFRGVTEYQTFMNIFIEGMAAGINLIQIKKNG